MLSIENPEVTLKEEGHGFPEGAESTGGIEWSINVDARGDDGKQYWIDCGMVGYPGLDVLAGMVQEVGSDMCFLQVRSERGRVVQSRDTIYKIAEFPNIDPQSFQAHPNGSIKIERSEGQVAVELGHTQFICKEDGTWHYKMECKETGLKADFVHKGIGYPMWYHDKKKLESFSPNSVGGGYHWPGTVEGTLTIDGRQVRIKGKGARQRYYAANYSSVEAAGWHDWLWFHFDEMFGGLDEMRVTKHKVMSLYLVDEKQYFSVGSFDIEHHDWAYLPQYAAFIPSLYKITVETEAGVLEMTANIVGSYVWAIIELPDAPFAMLDWDNVEGTFTHKDGRKRTLTKGAGANMVRQWRTYPNVFAAGIGAKSPE